MKQSKFDIHFRSLFLILGLLSFITTVQAQIKSDFTADTINGCAPLVVKFKDVSTGNPTGWFWDLGNGTTSTTQNPTTFYFDPGKYTVKLVVQNASGKDSVVKTNFITVNSAPSINFGSSNNIGCYPLNVNFTDLTLPGTGTSTSWQWDFGDGNTSTLQNPSHTYTSAGNFAITLKVTNSSGCVSTLSKPAYIRILGGLKANFGFNPPPTCKPPTVISFIDSSAGDNINSYLWTFGDGGTSTLKNPLHTYLLAGSYTVKLVVTNAAGCKDSLVKTNAVVVGTVRAGFTTTDTACQNSAVSFIGTSTPAPISVTWNFGDGTTSTNTNPLHSFSGSGTYTVKLVTDFGACKDSVSRTIYIRPKPFVDFAVNSFTPSCVPPVTVSYTNKSVGAVSYLWKFGDGASSTVANPTHTYTTVGSFDVTLIIVDNKGCSDSIVKPNAVDITPPHITGVVGIPYRGCVPYDQTFRPLINTSEPIATYFWDFGDGATSTLSNPFHSYTNEGSYKVRLIITSASGCIDSFVALNAVIINNRPTANFTATPRDACAFKPIQFTSASTGTITSYSWYFGDGGGSGDKDPQYLYTDTGYFTVSLVVKNNYCIDSISLKNYIHISPPIAAFTYTINCDTPLLRRFQERAIAATSWKWNFGDGGTSTNRNPDHIYTGPGTYYVTLEVSNGTCTNSVTDTINVIDEHPDFTISDTSICKNNSIIYTGINMNPANIVSYAWVFGDGTGTVTAVPKVSYAYSTAGNFSPILITRDIQGCNDTVRHSYNIRIYGPKASFTNPPGICLNGTIPFTDQSTADSIYQINKWTWDFGDSTIQTYTSPPFSHTYAKTGSYNVKLSITDIKGCTDTIIRPNAVLITKPVAKFSYDSISCSNNGVRFINQSQGVGLKYFWTFGDGNTSTDIDPIHIYSSIGSYIAKLFITDRFGCLDSITTSKAIIIANPVASFLSSDTVGTCPPFIVNLTNTSQNFASVLWDFGDQSFSNIVNPAHFYNYPGTYQLKLVVYGYGSCADTITKAIFVKGPTGTLTYDTSGICNPGTITFTASTKNNASFIWDFSDGNTLSTPDSTVSHTYTSPGIYKPRMLLIDQAGCRVPITGLHDIVVADVNAHIARLSGLYCDSASINFVDSSVAINDKIASYLWKFGDGTSSQNANPKHTFTAPGFYSAQLVVTTQKGCKDTTVLAPLIKIVQSPLINITGDSTACVNQSLTFKGNFLRADTSSVAWAWNFANGNSASVQNPPTQTYTASGLYNVKATATNSSGCTNIAFRSVVINPIPSIDAGADSIICIGQKITLQPSGATSFTWIPDPTLSCSNCTNPIASPTNPVVKYYVSGSNQFGCTNKDSVTITVVQRFKISVTPPDTLCSGESINLVATGTDFYTWSPSTGLSNPTIANPVAKPLATTNYQVIGTDYRGCFKDTAFVPITVYPVPQFDIVQSNITLAVGSSVQLTTTNSSDIIKWTWFPSQYLSCNNCPQPIASPHNTITYKAVALNEGGCKTTDEVTIQVICNNGNFYIPNTFSPNNDGMNDVFYPRGKGIAGIRSLTVYNRWGAVVYQRLNFAANDASAGWDGTYNGNKLSPDVYIYAIEIICENNEIFPVKGNVTLIR